MKKFSYTLASDTRRNTRRNLYGSLNANLYTQQYYSINHPIWRASRDLRSEISGENMRLNREKIEESVMRSIILTA